MTSSEAKLLKMEEQERVLRDKLISALGRASAIHATFRSRYSVRERIDGIINDIRFDRNNHFVTLAAGPDGRISYARSFGDRFNPTKKSRLALARYVRRVLKVSDRSIPDVDLEAFQESFKLAIQSSEELSKQIKVLRGNAVSDYYRNTYIKSCMTGEGKTKKIELYAINPDKVGLVVIGNLARGLLWSCDGGETYLDRVYGSRMGYAILKDWALKKGYLIKGKHDLRYLEVTLKLFEDTGTPYMDTFYYGKVKRDDNRRIVGVLMKPNNFPGYDVLFSDTGLDWR